MWKWEGLSRSCGKVIIFILGYLLNYMKNTINRKKILFEATNFFRDTIAQNHISNLNNLRQLDKFSYNPFLLEYLAAFMTGKVDSEGMAQALIYPRILGTSINTSFGSNLQKFCSTVLPGYGSGISGIDLEFVDQKDKRKKYCQIKAGSQTINKDDVKTIKEHFKTFINIARTNHLKIAYDDLVVGVLYGDPNELSFHYHKIQENYPVFIGQEFWYRLTGDKDFYFDLVNAFGKVALETDAKDLLDEVIKELALDIRRELQVKK